MRKKSRLIPRTLLLLLPVLLRAAEQQTAAVIVADSRHLTGLRAWWANLYNESHFQFALLTVVMIPMAGMVLGTIADFIMKRIGIDLKSRVLREG
jgi:hypothetical protein